MGVQLFRDRYWLELITGVSDIEIDLAQIWQGVNCLEFWDPALAEKVGRKIVDYLDALDELGVEWRWALDRTLEITLFFVGVGIESSSMVVDLQGRANAAEASHLGGIVLPGEAGVNENIKLGVVSRVGVRENHCHLVGYLHGLGDEGL
ncbi:hypothetical protein KNSL1_009480 [Colletotrichum chrysophilum]|nr:hypothetical protein Brms1b_011770 [Colletotrichum noveboracense]KAJ0344297.1 hypothetical protein KNSL1_009480 [Colletotrichum chrysophilum]